MGRALKVGKLRRHSLLICWTVVFAYYYAVNGDQQSPISEGLFKATESAPAFPQGVETSEGRTNNNKPRKYAESEVPGVNCTPPGIDDFPTDLFTQHQRQQGWVVIHFLISMYIFVALAVVCDDYFVPSMERICEELHLPSDVAGATFMAIATSAPELFTNIIGTFITKGDIGVGTIVGSAVFNILAVAAVCGIGAGMVVPLEWWSVTRDCFCYSVTVILLLVVLRDERIYWYEALVLVLVYLIYILVMYKNTALKRGAEKLVFKAEKRLKKDGRVEKTYSTGGVNNVPQDEEVNLEAAFKMSDAEREQEEQESATGLCDLPRGEGCKSWTEWIICWPSRLFFTVTIPDCRQPRWKKWYPLTFAMCIVWIGTLSYIVNWMMTIIGHTCKIPDSVMGLTFIAAGTSVPEVVSSLIVARQGLGTMAVSNSIGSNTFDVLMCLGIPWLIRASMLIGDKEEDYIQINSKGLEYSTMMLIGSVAVLYIILAANGFKLDRKVGYLSLLLYSMFLVMASLFELNVFFTVTLPTCQYHED